MRRRRRAGILLHITSLPGGPYTGDIGPSAHAFANFLADAGQSYWQMLPINPIGWANSPYSSMSSFAAEPLLISPEVLRDDDLIEGSQLARVPSRAASWKANFARSRRLRARLLREAYRSFVGARPQAFARALAAFTAREAAWLRDYCLFRALSEHFRSLDWTRWPRALARRESRALRRASQEHREAIDYAAFEQFVFQRQWDALKKHCRTMGVRLIGDLPMFVAHDSADVWANQRAFLLYANGRPRFVAGAPPDAFSPNGQRWGNALYDWTHHQRTGFAWWRSRIKRQLALFDIVRLDHFIGFSRYWRISSRAKTAKRGRWVPVPGRKFFDVLKRDLGKLPLIAEDLGAVTQEVWDLRDRFALPGMKVLQFAYGDNDPENIHRPENYPVDCVAYTGTHDCDTTVGWYRALKRGARLGDRDARAALHRVQHHLETKTEKQIVRAATEALYASRAHTAILPLQDALGLDGRHRMNTPGVAKGNWAWRVKQGKLDTGLTGGLRALAEQAGRR